MMSLRRRRRLPHPAPSLSAESWFLRRSWCSFGAATAWLCWFLPVFAAVGARAQTAPEAYRLDTPLIRVDLTRFSGRSAVSIRGVPGARLFGPDGKQLDSGPGPWVFRLSGGVVSAEDSDGRPLGAAVSGSVLRVQPGDADALVALSSTGLAGRRYRGALEVGSTAVGPHVAGKLRVVNEVTLEAYLRSVIVCEMGGRAPVEALKAQAVAARTYALCVLSQGLTGGGVLSDTSDQVYGGADVETARANAAVEATDGLILTLGGQPIFAQYCADCGGFTAPGRTTDACPHAVDDSEAHNASEALRRAVWTLRFAPERLAALVNPHSAPPGALSNVEVAETDLSGRVRRVVLTWKPTVSASPGSADPPATASAEPPNSTGTATGAAASPQPAAPAGSVPAVTTEISGNTLRNILGWDTLRSTLFTVQRDPDGTFVLAGRGWGHGHGLCQLGAMALADPPLSRDFRTILLHYYDGAAIQRVVYPDCESVDLSGSADFGRPSAEAFHVACR